MLVEINLLPQREPRKFAFLIILCSLLALLIIVGVVYFWQINSTKNELTSIDRQISMTRKVTNKENKNTETVVSSSSVNQLKSAIKWANDYPIQTIPVMQQLNSLLPERGFIQSFGYTDAGTITLSVQFDSAREAAYFLTSLTHSDWIGEASLTSLSTTAQKDSTTSTTATNSAGTTNTSGSTTTSDTQTNTAPVGQSNQGGSTSTTTNSNNSSASTANGSTDTNYLPRYLGQFEIKLNKETIKKTMEKSKVTGEGVTGS